MSEEMNEWVILKAAYREWMVDKKKAPTVKQIIQSAQMMWVTWRDVSIQVWAENTFAHVPQERLSALLGKVDYLLLLSMGIEEWCNDDWEYPSEEVEAEWVAWGLALLRWKNRVANGRELAGFNLSEAEVEAWLAQREWIPVSANPDQPSLFGGM